MQGAPTWNRWRRRLRDVQPDLSGDELSELESDVLCLADAVITTTHPMLHFKDAERQRYFDVEKRCRLSRYGGDCYGYALVAMGFVDLVIETDLKRWDIAPLIPIIEGAGGIVTNWEGRSPTQGGNVIAGGDRRVHAEALKILSR